MPCARTRSTACEQARDLLDGVDRQIEASLAGAAGLVRTDGSFSVAAFERFATELAEASDLTALAFEPVVPAIVADSRRTSVARSSTWRRARRRRPRRPVHYPMRVVAPASDTTEALLGFDLQGDPMRSAAAARPSRPGGWS